MPEWMPGAAFKREARELRDTLDRLKEIPFEKVLENIVSVTFVLLYVLLSRSGKEQ